MTGAASAGPVHVDDFAGVTQVGALALEALPVLATAKCSASAEVRARALGSAPSRTAVGPLTYDDDIGDVATAPDICAMNLVTNDNTAVMIALHIHDRSPFSPGDLYGIYFNTDSDTATGTDTDSGAPLGAEYALEIVYGRPWLLLWNGSSFDAVLPQMPIRVGWIDGFGLVLQIGRADLGDPRAFDFAFMTVHGDRDFAPDSGMWSYKLSPFALTAGQLSVGSARAGRPLIAHMTVERSDLGIALREGAVRCSAKLGGKMLVGRGSFSLERAVCKWRVPRNTGGKRVAGTVSVTFDSARAKRSFSKTVA